MLVPDHVADRCIKSGWYCWRGLYFGRPHVGKLFRMHSILFRSPFTPRASIGLRWAFVHPSRSRPIDSVVAVVQWLEFCLIRYQILDNTSHSRSLSEPQTDCLRSYTTPWCTIVLPCFPVYPQSVLRPPYIQSYSVVNSRCTPIHFVKNMRFVVLLHQWDTHSLNIPKSHLYTFASSVHLKFIRQWRMVAAWFLQQCWPNKDNSSKSLGGFPMCIRRLNYIELLQAAAGLVTQRLMR